MNVGVYHPRTFQNRSSTSPQNLKSATTPDSQATLIHIILPKSEPDTAISAATKAFKLDFLREWRTPHVIHPRGLCLLNGQIGILGANGRCKVSVTATYLPKEDRFVSITVTHAETCSHRQARIGRKKPENVSKLENDSSMRWQDAVISGELTGVSQIFRPRRYISIPNVAQVNYTFKDTMSETRRAPTGFTSSCGIQSWLVRSLHSD